MTHLPEGGQLLHQQVSALRFSRSAFAADHDALVGVVRHHGLIGHVGHGKDVRRISRPLGADVQLGMLGKDGVQVRRDPPTEPGMCTTTDLRGVDLHGVERVDRDENVAHIRVDLVPAVATLELLRHLVLE